MLSVAALVDDSQDDLQLEWLAGQEGSQRSMTVDGRAAADLIGHFNLTHPARIQVLGQEELDYLSSFPKERCTAVLEEMVAGGVPAILFGDGITPSEEILAICKQGNIPLLTTAVPASEAIDVLRIHLSRRIAPTTIMHGVFMDVLGLGVLITGESGLGKSELALELISRGHGLVADDAVEFSRPAPRAIDGRCPELLRNLLEVRGLGLLDIRTIFGETAVRRRMRLKLIVHLVRATAGERFERLPMQDLTQDILGEPVRKVILQVAAGRNLAVLVEAAVRNTVLKLRGIDTLKEFMKKQTQAIAQGSSHDQEG